jgi:hypothetical protein
MAEAIRLPFWDWTNAEVPNLLTARSVTVLDFETGQPTTIRNPLGFYEYVVSAGPPAAFAYAAYALLVLPT